MKKMFVFLAFISFVAGQFVQADDSVYIPGQKIKHQKKSITINGNPYDSETGYDFTGNGKPRYYDPMYSGFFIDRPQYNMLQNYPTFHMPVIRGRGK